MNLLDRSIKPGPKEEINFTLPGIESFSLSNGLKVYFIRKEKLPIVQLSFVFNAGSKFDREGKKGLANLFSMIIDEGAGKYDSLQLSDEFDKLGTHFNIHTTEDNIYIVLQTLSENFKRSTELITDVITKPHLKQKDFERERRKILTRLIQLKDEADEIADLVFSRMILGDENPYAYPVIGFEKDIQSIEIEDIKNFYSSFILPNNGAVIAVGDTTKEELKNILNQNFEGWLSGKFPEVKHKSTSDKEIKFFIVDKKDAVQSEIRVGHLSSKRSEKDYYSKTLMNMILGGQFSSRINLNLREKNGYTYGATSRFSYLKEGAFFSVSTSVNIENTAAAIKEIINELNGIRGGIKEDELEFAKASIVRKFPSNFETYRQIATNLTAFVIHSLPENYFNRYIENIESVSLKDVNEIAEKNIFPDELIIVAVGDKNKLKSQLNEIAKGEIYEVDFNGNLITA